MPGARRIHTHRHPRVGCVERDLADRLVGTGRHRGPGPHLGGRRLHDLGHLVGAAGRVGHHRGILGATEAGERVGQRWRVECDRGECAATATATARRGAVIARTRVDVGIAGAARRRAAQCVAWRSRLVPQAPSVVDALPGFVEGLEEEDRHGPARRPAPRIHQVVVPLLVHRERRVGLDRRGRIRLHGLPPGLADRDRQRRASAHRVAGRVLVEVARDLRHTCPSRRRATRSSSRPPAPGRPGPPVCCQFHLLSFRIG